MVIDSSAMMAILMKEPERMDFLQRIAADAERLVSIVSYVECSMLMYSRKGQAGLAEFDALLRRFGMELMAADAGQAGYARVAFMEYGKGIHPAKLNLGDLFSYALAKQTGEPLLFKGSDFSQTDIARAAVASA